MFLDGYQLGQHATEPLRVDEVQVIEETAVLKVQQDPAVVEEVGGLVDVRFSDLV